MGAGAGGKVVGGGFGAIGRGIDKICSRKSSTENHPTVEPVGQGDDVAPVVITSGGTQSVVANSNGAAAVPAATS